MDKNVFVKFAKVLGFEVNEEALEPIENKYDQAYPGDWNTMSDDEKKSLEGKAHG